MRIGLTCTTIEPALTQGKIDGIGIYTKTLLEQFQSLQHTVIPYSFLKRHQSPGFPQGERFPLSYTAASIASLCNPIANILYNNIKNKIDLLHVTDHMIPRVKNIPIVATIHDALMFKHPEWYRSKLRGLKNFLRKETMQWATHFITISNAMIPELVELLGIKEEKISVVYNGISPVWYEEIPEEKKKIILQKLTIPEKFILFTGTLQPKKNLPRIIDAFLKLPKDIQDEYPLVISGKAGWNCKESLAAIDKLKLQKTGYWLNYTTQEELRALYQSATLYVCPSLHEGFGYTLLEGLASKTPVITSNISAMPEIANDAAYLVDPLSVSEISQGLLTLLTNDQARKLLVRKGIERARDFSLEKCARETFQVYQNILKPG